MTIAFLVLVALACGAIYPACPASRRRDPESRLLVVAPVPAVVVMGLLPALMGCVQAEDRQYEMKWRIEPTIHEEWGQAEDVYLTFVDDPDTTLKIVSDDLGGYLRSLDTDSVMTTWKTDVYLYFIDDPVRLKRVGDLETWDRRWWCWILE